MAYDRVDLPEPLGPMIAWVSPERTVRSTPLRIWMGSALASELATSTCRSRTSRTEVVVLSLVDMKFLQDEAGERSDGVVSQAGRSGADGCEFGFDCGFEAIAHLGNSDLVDDFVEEPTY